jgi:anaerobic selenocysteine-containing dehydrogenase
MAADRTVYTACRICAGQCGLAIDLDEQGALGRIRGDQGNPLTRGYACIKGLSLGEAHTSPNRILRPLKRQPDGSFTPIALDDALDDIAERLSAVIARDGPDAVAGFRGTMNYTNSLAAHMLPAWLEAMGSHSFYSTMTIDQSAKWITAGRLGAWEAGKDPYDSAEVLLIIGANPLVSLSTFTMVMQNPVKALKEAKARGVRLLVIDPRRTETAEFADLHLQPLPGEDAALVAGMIRLIFDRGWADEAFCACHAEGVEALRAAVDPFTPEEVARRCDISAEALVEVTRAFAAPHACGRRKRGAAASGTGPDMGPWSNLAEHLVECLNVLCGRFAREGDRIGNPGVLGPRWPRRAQAVGPARSWESGWRDAWGHGLLMGERMTAALPEAILGAGTGAVRALIVDGGNPVNALADTRRAADAFARLPLLVSIDPFFNETSRLAHYILPPPMMLERADIRSRDWEAYTLHEPYSQFSEAVLAPPAGSELIDDWRVFWELARRTGHAISFDGVPIDMEAPPPQDSLFRILLRHSAFPAGELLGETRGAVFGCEPMLVGPAQADSPRFQLAPADITAELAALAAVRRPVKALRLICGRIRDVQNSMYHDLPAIARRMTTNPLAMNPDDMAERGLQNGDTATAATAHGRISVTTVADKGLRRGVVTLNHGWGDGRGVNVNALTSLTEGRQAINAMPVLSGFDVEIEACADLATGKAT